jgi:hypothetical protein
MTKALMFPDADSARQAWEKQAELIADLEDDVDVGVYRVQAGSDLASFVVMVGDDVEQIRWAGAIGGEPVQEASLPPGLTQVLLLRHREVTRVQKKTWHVDRHGDDGVKVRVPMPGENN